MEYNVSENIKDKIINLEAKIEKFISDLLNEYQLYFTQNGYILGIEFERINESKAIYGIKDHSMDKNQCLEPNYYSLVSIAVKWPNGSLIGDEDDGYLIDNIPVWNVNLSYTPKKNKVKNLVSLAEIKEEIEMAIKEFATELKIRVS
jgi:hypothetical protein